MTQTSQARIINSTIQGNARGIVVSESSSARIGFLSGSDTVAQGNDIVDNARDGIFVSRSSSARIVGNNISNNGDDGIDVHASMALTFQDSIQ